jgi:type II secretory pathway component PulM
MVLVTNNWRMWLLGLGASLIIFLVVFFVAIKPAENTANQAVKSGLQQTQQAINQAQKSISNSSGQAGAAGSAATKTLNSASKLAACVSAAGTDASKLSQCEVKFGG